MAQKRRLANWLQGYANYTRHSESPDLFHFWTGVFTIAGALRRQVWIDQRYFQWTPNFYIILVGPPGIAAKSTSLGLGTDLLRQIDSVKFGPDSMTWQGLTDALAEAQQLVPMVNGLSIEETEYLTMSCVTCSVSELGTFLRPEDGTMTDVLVDLWDGRMKPWKRRTKGMEGRVEINNPWIHVMGCTTPAWLSANYTEVMIGGGLTSRIVWVYADQKRRFVAYPSQEVGVTQFADESKDLVHDLQIISELKGAYELTPEAYRFGTEWYNRHWKTKPEHMASDRYGGYLARKQTHIHKLAIVLAAARKDELVIDAQDLDLSEKMMTGLEASMAKVFESIGSGENSRYVNEILAYVRAYGEIGDRALWRHMLPIMGPKEYSDATAAAIKAGYLKVMSRGADMVYIALRDPKPPGTT